MKKLWFVMLASVIVLSLLLSACGNSENNANEGAQSEGQSGQKTGDNADPNPKEDSDNKDSGAEPKGKLRIMAGVVGGKTPEENDLFEKEIQRLTGFETELNKPASDYDKKLLAAIGAGEKYDLLHVSKSMMNELIRQGAVQPLTDFVEGSDILSDPTVLPTKEWEQIRYEDGEIYGVFMKFQGGTMPIVRQDWLDKLELDTPETLDDYYNVLKAFKEQDPDGNGQDDTYGLSTAGLYDIQGFMSGAGVKYRYVMQDGKRTIPYATEAAIPVYEFFAKLYQEGIMDPNFVTNDTGKMRNLFLTDRVGMVTYWDAWVGMFNNMKHQEDPNTPFEAKGIKGAVGPDGQIVLRRGDPDVWVIPANAENPENAKAFLNFWHTEPGIMLGSLGIKDHDYTLNNGNYELTETGVEHNMDHGVPFWYNENVKPPFGKLPGVQAAQDIISEYGTLETTLPEWSDAQKIVENYAFKAMTAQMPAAEAVAAMHRELLDHDLIDE